MFFKNYIQLNRILVCLIPFSLIFSIFIADLILSFVSLFFVIYLIKEKKLGYLNNNFFKIFLIFFFLLISGSIFSEFKVLSIQKTLPYIRFGLFMVLIIYLLENDLKFKFFFLRSLLLCFFAIAIGLILQILGLEFISESKPYSRYTSFFMDESIMGSYLMKLLPLSMALLFALNFKKIYIILFLLLSSLMITISGERSAAILLFLFIIIFIFFTNFAKFKYKVIIFLCITSLISSSLYFFPEVKFRIIDRTLYQLGIIEPDSDYVEIQVNEKYLAVVREEHFIPLKYYLMFSSSLKMFKDDPLFGKGVKTFRILCNDKRYFLKKSYKAFKDKSDDFYKGYTGLTSCSTHPHNYYIQLLAETGLFTFIIFLSIFIFSIYRFFNEVFIYRKLIYVALFLNFFPFLFTGSLFNNFISILFFIPIGFIKFKSNKDYK